MARAASDPTLTVVVSGLGKVQVAPSNLTCQSRCTTTVGTRTTLTLTATPAGGFVFIGWRGVDCTSGIRAVCVLRPDVDTTATAVFAIASVTRRDRHDDAADDDPNNADRYGWGRGGGGR